MNVSRTVLDAALSLARGYEEKHRDRNLKIVINLTDEGFYVAVNDGRGPISGTPVRWHDIEHRQYDAFREAINFGCLGV